MRRSRLSLFRVVPLGPRGHDIGDARRIVQVLYSGRFPALAGHKAAANAYVRIMEIQRERDNGGDMATAAVQLTKMTRL